MTGPGAVIFWLGVCLTGAAIGWALMLGLTAIVRYLDRHEIKADYGDELAPETLTERRRRARFTSLIAVLGLLAVPVVALTR